jgi:glycosidase
MRDRKGPFFPFGFPLSKRARDTLHVAELTKAEISDHATAETYNLRRLADRINELRKNKPPEKTPVRAGHLQAMGLLTDILRFVMDKYCFEEYPGALKRGFSHVRQHCLDLSPEMAFEKFMEFFPAEDVANGTQSVGEFLSGGIRNRTNRETVAREMVLLFLSMVNHALEPFQDLFHDGDFQRETKYSRAVECLNSFFNREPPLDPLGKTLFEILYAPMSACPDSLEGQLEWILENWRAILPEFLLRRLLLTWDILQEETRGRGPVGGSVDVLRFDHAGEYPEYDRYSQDRGWMPNAVLMTKSTHVWLSQLSKKYGRHIATLDQIPDEELDQLARWGFTGLWLIGLWERSPASRRIKQIMGNPEALSSAYSLYDYVVASDLGSEEAFQNLRHRAWQRGIRLASDMVPNHVGVYSRWVIEHPDWFIQLDYPPYPDYSFTGENLSRDDRVAIQIEDGYWSHSNAAVVFKRTDNWTGTVKYIYHGNDGTHMPWNDTAQLNYLNPEVREAAIQSILHVARKFPIIRFDAAMTLAKKHYQRLWFPIPGQGGAIPSRSEHGMAREEFDQHMPEEFWREVVDRVASEVPDTLLIAEAFWLMEGYFVRTLGMHRVYNSAFMNMLKMEENANYRTTMKNVLEFSPGILQRFVNFMNNPDERTAVEQFGKGDKYFGVAVLMATMPGLPMFGHGQIEGFTEKYGMEYSRAYWDEPTDHDLVRRHEKEIFPLMRKRYLFSGVENFALYDFMTPEGHVNEDVFAYSNRRGDERGLIVYNNRYNTTSGWIRRSTAINRGTPQQPQFTHKTLAEALAINGDKGYFYAFRDHSNGLEYIRSGTSLMSEGLFVELHAYQYYAFLNFREIYDQDGTWSTLASDLGGRGVPSVDHAHRELVLKPLLDPFREIMNAETIRELIAPELSPKEEREFQRAFARALESLADAAAQQRLPSGDANEMLQSIRTDVAHFPGIRHLLAEAKLGLGELKRDQAALVEQLAVWSILRSLKRIFVARESEQHNTQWMDEWLLTPIVQSTLTEMFEDKRAGDVTTQAVRVLLAFPELLQQFKPTRAADYFQKMMTDPIAQECLEINEYGDTVWFSKERMNFLLDFAVLIEAFKEPWKTRASKKQLPERFSAVLDRCESIRTAAEKSGYRLETFLEMLS